MQNDACNSELLCKKMFSFIFSMHLAYFLVKKQIRA